MRNRLLLSFLLLILSSATFAQTAKVGTVTVKSGDSYENVSFTVDHYYKVIKFTADGKKKTVSITDIVMITNSNSEDITEKSLGKSYYLVKKTQTSIDTVPSQAASDSTAAISDTSAAATDTTVTHSDTTVVTKPDDTFTTQVAPAPTTEWKSKTDVVHNKREPYLYSYCFRPHLNLGAPSGSYYRATDAGLGGGVDISLPVGDEIAIWTSIGRVGMKLTGLSATHYLFGVEYFNYAGQRSQKSILPNVYLSTGLGVISHSGGKIVNGGSKFAVPFQAGLILPLGKNTGIDIGGEFYAVYGEGRSTSYPYKTTTGVIGSIWQIHFGLALAGK